MTEYLTSADILFIHKDQIERYGGSDGVRDGGLLETALYRPQTDHYKNTIEKAAALWESLAQDRPFLDGNTRVALAATYVFLKINGITITASAEKIYNFMAKSLEDGGFDFETLLRALRANTAV